MNYAVNEHYWLRYLRFIKSRKPSDGYVERHHIYPKSMFPQLANEPDNIVALSAREHFIAHWMLHKAFGGAMTKAFMYMRSSSQSNRRYWNLNSKSYENLRQALGAIWSEQKTGKKMSDVARAAMSAGRVGKPLSASHREAIGAGNKGKFVSDITRKRISEAKIGKTPNRIVTDDYRTLLKRPKPRKVCEHCSKSVAINLFDRWHGNNCKHKVKESK